MIKTAIWENSLKNAPDHNIYLEVSDNGIGLTQDQNSNFNQSMGIRLMRGLVEQIGGNLKMNTMNGFCKSTTFHLDRLLNVARV